MNVFRCFALLAVLGLCLPLTANAAFLVEIDTDGADDGPVTYHPNFSFGGDTTSASSSIASNAPGLTPADSIFGGDGVNDPDTYLATYTPGVDADNWSPAVGTDLGDGNVAYGLPGGGSGQYNVYATWPFTSNVSSVPTGFTLSDAGGTIFSTQINQNDPHMTGNLGFGHVWWLAGTANLTAGTEYTLAQTSDGGNSFVSMRASGYLFQKVPEPSSLLLLGMAVAGSALVNRRRS